MIENKAGDLMENDEAQRRILATIERTGKFILSAPLQPRIGEVQDFSGLPMRCVRYTTYEAAVANACDDLWGHEDLDPEDFFFEVEVAD